MSHKLLLADDSITIQKVVGIIFANEDYQLTVVDNGNAALEKAAEIKPDVILVDAVMPGKSGYDVCNELRQDPALKEVPVLLLVGAFEPFDEEKAKASGADDHITKPFESQQLIEKVKKLIVLGEERANAPVASPPAFAANDIAETTAVAGLAAAATAGDQEPGPPLDDLEVVEASPEDDLWGVFEAEELAEDEEVHEGEIVPEEEFGSEIIDTVEEINPFVFEEEEEATFSDEEVLSASVESEAGTADDGAFMYSEEPEVTEGFAVEEPSIDTPEPAAFISSFTPAPFSVPEQDAFSMPDVASEEAESEKSAAPEAINLTEQQLAQILSRVSREIIEKIAWEVVPDLAEKIIREEIRKIKEGC